MNRHPMLALLVGITVTWPAFCDERDLIVVDDLGGTPALPYYRALNLPARNSPQALLGSVPVQAPAAGARYGEADMLPVRSTRLTPGPVEHRAVNLPGLAPLFLIGDDDRSRTWLRRRLPQLQALRAVGLVVNVSSADALASLRELAPGLILAPSSGDDLGARLRLRHYPLLITATGIEQ